MKTPTPWIKRLPVLQGRATGRSGYTGRQAPDKQTQLLTRTHPVASHVTRFICGKVRPPDAGDHLSNLGPEMHQNPPCDPPGMLGGSRTAPYNRPDHGDIPVVYPEPGHVRTINPAYRVGPVYQVRGILSIREYLPTKSIPLPCFFPKLHADGSPGYR